MMTSLQPRPIQAATPINDLLVLVTPGAREGINEWIGTLNSSVRNRLDIQEFEDMAQVADRHVLVVGNYENNPVIRRLYHLGWSCTDAIHPGPGGYELKTLCGPFSPTRNVILVGASDDPGARLGLQQLGQWLDLERYEIPFLFDGQASELVSLAVASDREDQAPGIHDQEDPGLRAENRPAFLIAGVHAIYLNDFHFADLFKQGLLQFLAQPFRQHIPYPVILFFRLLEPLECWTIEERETVVRALHNEMTSGDTRLVVEHCLAQQNGRTPNPIDGPTSRAALSTFFLGHYFMHFYNHQEGREAVSAASKVFEPELAGTKPASDSSAEQWKVSLLNTATYALAAEKLHYLDQGFFRAAVKRAIQCFTNQGSSAISGQVAGPGSAPWTLFSMAAAYYADPTFLTPFLFWSPHYAHLLRPWWCGDELFRSYATSLPPNVDPDLVGLCITPLDQRSRTAHQFTSPPLYTRPPLEHDAFDKITFRSGFRQEDNYLLLDGVAGGIGSFEDANCIKQMEMRGAPWLCAFDIGLRESSIAAQNGLLVLRNGHRGPMPQFAELLGKQAWAAGGHVVTRIPQYNGTNWTRSVFWRASSFLLVIDEIEILLPGRFHMEARWFVLGRYTPGRWPAFELGDTAGDVVRLSVGWDDSVEPEIDELDFSNEFYALSHEQNLGIFGVFSHCNVPHVVHRIRLRKAFNAEPGQRASIATRFVCTTPGGDLRKEYSLERDTTVIFVEVPQARTEEFPFSDEVEPFTLDLEDVEPETGFFINKCKPTAAEKLSQQGLIVFGFEDGRVIALDANTQEIAWTTELSGKVNAIAHLAFGGRIYIYAGTEEGDFRCVDAGGATIWRAERDSAQHDVAGKLESPYSAHHRGIRTLAAVSTLKQAVLVAGLADGYIYRIDAFNGQDIWEAPLARGTPAHLILEDIDNDGIPEVITAMANPAADASAMVFSLHGKRLGILQAPHDSTRESASEATFIIAADIDGDGRNEIIKGASTPFDHVSCWRGFELLWTFDAGDWPCTAQAMSQSAVLIGSRSGWAFLIDHRGQLLFSDYIAETILSSTIHRGKFIIGGRAGGIFALDPTARSLEVLKRVDAPVHSLLGFNERLIAVTSEGELFIS